VNPSWLSKPEASAISSTESFPVSSAAAACPSWSREVADGIDSNPVYSGDIEDAPLDHHNKWNIGYLLFAR
jgi:hypothetical protein